ncbi:DUF2207 domain-containing protein [Mucilaginibacter conchicola]|uniref:DUF2207 domain-containing protein n=1 Tax=Mucilaginibacter conchicola TaxID=2303333 RepID=A0A372NXE3_9SPHI|nr:DUF2207 domain-containing protein [Mucilaginibacter conchicola]RFZ94780.1 DUF2207 domain-containing protein [Mucilaginibacter conchicola]
MIKRISLIICSLVFLGLHAFAQDSVQTERIINFHSDISIDSTGLVKVTEHIKVYAAGDRIQHGLLRKIPLYRTDRLGTSKKVDFEITDVKKNNVKEPYKTKEESGNRNIYVGSADVYLEKGIYEYAITYQSRGHIGFFDGYDELYWNVTGNDWDFNIEQASATITFPGGAKGGNVSCYTGVSGSTATDCNSNFNPDGSVTFKAAHQLNQGEGFTVAAAFTAGIIKRPGKWELMYQDYFNVIAGAAMLLIFAGIYYALWNKYGRDPVKPVVVPTFHIPQGWSPALLRYFDRKGYDDKGSAISIINMAVKKTVKINATDAGSKEYQFVKLTEDTDSLANEERAFFNEIFSKQQSIKTTSSNARKFTAARKDHRDSVVSQLKLTDYFVSNSRFSIWMAVFAVIALIAYLISVGEGKPLFLLFLLPFIAFGVSFFINGIKGFKDSIGGSIIMIIFGLIFGGVPLVMAVLLIGFSSPVTMVVILGMVVMYIVFLKAIKNITFEGIEIKSQVDGFKLYLSTAEENRLNLLNPPELTPQVFEKFLPYAIALGLENAWGNKFSAVLDAAGYEPDWYTGEDDYRRFAYSVPSSFYNSVSITPPSTSTGSSSGSSGSSSWSSGSSGGGSSGGGGGGGGGGGW